MSAAAAWQNHTVIVLTSLLRARRRLAAASRRTALLTLVVWLGSVPARGQTDPRTFVGGLFGVSALSADAHTITGGSTAAISLYKPENGVAANLFAGRHLAQYFSAQANWIWNRNDVTLFSSTFSPRGGAFYEQRRHSRQHAVVLDGLIYFRRLGSAVRPYLGTGLAVVRFSTGAIVASSAQDLEPPAGPIAATRVALRSHVGIDVKLSRRLNFRYSFSETIGPNPISAALTPPAPRPLANFQNLFGFVGRF